MHRNWNSPAESLKVRVDDRAIGWLQRDVLEKIKEKHGWNYKIFSDDELVNRIVIYGDIPDEKVEELKNPVGWAFAAASGLIEGPKKAEKTEKEILERAKKMFPNEIIDKLEFEVSNQNLIVKPKGYLGSKLFSELADIARNKLGGEYISAGKDSHFKIPLEAMKQ